MVKKQESSQRMMSHYQEKGGINSKGVRADETVLQHDNVWPHTSTDIVEAIEHPGPAVLPHNIYACTFHKNVVRK